MTNEELKIKTEEIGLTFDKLGMPPMASRVVAYLLLSEPPFRSFDEIIDHLQASKSSISTTLKYLENNDLIKYRTYPGDRRRFFYVSPGSWASQFDIQEKLKSLVNLLDQVIELRSKDDTDLSPRLIEVRDKYKYFEAEIPLMLERWEMIKQSKKE